MNPGNKRYSTYLIVLFESEVRIRYFRRYKQSPEARAISGSLCAIQNENGQTLHKKYGVRPLH